MLGDDISDSPEHVIVRIRTHREILRMSSIVSSRLSFAWPDDTPLFADLSFTVRAAAPASSRPTAPARARCSS